MDIQKRRRQHTQRMNESEEENKLRGAPEIAPPGQCNMSGPWPAPQLMSPEEKGEFIKKCVDEGSGFVIDQPAIYYPPVNISEPERWERIDLSGAKLVGAKLAREIKHEAYQDPNSPIYRTKTVLVDIKGPRLRWIQLNDADLHDADLRRADLHGAILDRADLRSCNLEGANLTEASLCETDLAAANCINVNLEGANLSGANLVGAQLKGARITLSTFQRSQWTTEDVLRLSVNGIEIVGLNLFPSAVKRHLLDYDQISGDNARMLFSTFISYGGPDTDFAYRLNDVLLKQGVTTFFFAKDAIPGRKLHRLMRDGINEYDRVILVCSKASLDRPGVLNEITETLQREARDGGKEYLIPITLDDYVFSDWSPEDPGVAQAVRDRVVADFRGVETDRAKFDAGLRRLLSALKK